MHSTHTYTLVIKCDPVLDLTELAVRLADAIEEMCEIQGLDSENYRYTLTHISTVE